MISVVIFDLDETLADTGFLPPGRRTPSQLLSPGLGGRDWVTDQSLADLPGELICRGYAVIIATRAPRAYATTLIHLLGVDTQMLWASCGAGLDKAKRITLELLQLKIAPTECIYVGDGDHDREIAASAGCQYVHVSDARSGVLLASLPALSEIPQYRRPSKWVDGDFENVKHLFEVHPFADSEEDTLKKSGKLDNDGRAALACALLRVTPQRRSRRENQIELFANLAPKHALCVVDTDPFLQVNSRIVTKVELRRDSELRRAYLEGLGRCIPGVRFQMEVGAIAVEVRSVVDYQTTWGRALRTVKNYGNHDRNGVFRSGPEPELGSLDFIADVVAAQMLDLANSVVVPAPSNPYNDRQPGEVSRRLAHLVAHRVQLPVAEKLRREGANFVPNPTAGPRASYEDTNGFGETESLRRKAGLETRAVLIEDQITTGDSINRAVEALSHLPDDRYHRPVVVTYSVSRRVLTRCTTEMPDAPDGCGLQNMTEQYGVACRCGRNT